MGYNFNLSRGERELIKFIFEYRLEVEFDFKEVETLNYMKSIQGSYLKMFEAIQFYWDDERLTHKDRKIIDSVLKKYHKIIG